MFCCFKVQETPRKRRSGSSFLSGSWGSFLSGSPSWGLPFWCASCSETHRLLSLEESQEKKEPQEPLFSVVLLVLKHTVSKEEWFVSEEPLRKEPQEPLFSASSFVSETNHCGSFKNKQRKRCVSKKKRVFSEEGLFKKSEKWFVRSSSCFKKNSLLFLKRTSGVLLFQANRQAAKKQKRFFFCGSSCSETHRRKVRFQKRN